MEQSPHLVAAPRNHHTPQSVRLKGKDLFSSDVWKDPESASTFYTFIASLRKKIRDEVKQSTAAHRFIRTLRDSRRLIRCYTQNIDGLEAREGLCTTLERGKGSRSRFTRKTEHLPNSAASVLPGGRLDGGCEVVQLHGDLEVLRCNICNATCAWEEENREALLLGGRTPECKSCHRQDEERRDRGKRGTRIGSLRPNIVLYGEEHPSADAVGAISTYDLRLGPDVLLILGTSLHVHGLKALVKEFARAVHARAKGKGKVIFINLTKPPDSCWTGVIDYWVSMDCDKWVQTLRRHRPDLWQIQAQLDLPLKKADLLLPKKILEGQRVEKKENKENILALPRIPLSERSPSKTKSRGPLKAILNKPFKPPLVAQAVACAKKNSATSVVRLPTTPSSGNRNTPQDSSRKRSRPEEEDNPKPTPKRRKKEALEIWQE